MSISIALSNALTGLNATSRRAEVLSDNVANALTPGYASRSLEVSAASINGEGRGVRMEAVTRATDPRATFERRRTEAELGRDQTLAAGQTTLAAAMGGPDQAGSLTARAVALEDAIARLAETPESASLQTGAANAAVSMARALNAASDETQSVRMDADAAIARMVEDVNDALADIEQLNIDMQRLSAVGRSSAALEESRAQQIDRLAELIPVRVAQREGGAVALYTPGGAVLLEGRAFELGFDATGIITPDMTFASGALSGLTLDGRAVSVGTGTGDMDGGALGAQFQLRDVTAPEASDQLDAMARDLILRFEDATVDTTLTPGDPGLFTDEGDPFDALDVVGLAGRIEVNAAVDPNQGGEVWRLRDGVNAATEGPAGLDTLPRSHLAALADRLSPPAGAGVTGNFGFVSLVEAISADRLRAEGDAESDAAYNQGRFSFLSESEAASVGVNTDQEMANLLLVQEAYAANARVLETVDGLLRRLLEI